MRSIEQHLDFDLDLAKSKTNENPIYYLQYAHARVVSVMRQLALKNMDWDLKIAKRRLDLLKTNHEKELMLTLSRFPDALTMAANQHAPQNIVH